jgi:RNA 2',3'-cyclic 3'-phosphodiesterase
MRLFVAFDIDDAIRGKIARFLDSVRGFAPDVRWVRPESLHVTLKFIGEKAEGEVEKVKGAMETIASESFKLNFRGYGFFPSARAPRVFWIGIDAASTLSFLAAAVDEKLASLAIPKEEHLFTPHLTLARGGRGSGSPRKQKSDGPNRSFQRLQEKLAALSAPEFGTMTVHQVFLYQSQLSPAGSKYTKLAAFALR